MKNKIPFLFKIIFFIISVILITTIFFIIDNISNSKRSNDVKEIAYIDSSEKDIFESEVTGVIREEKKKYVELETKENEYVSKTSYDDEISKLVVDISMLQNSNPDIFAWISIPDTNVDYPIVQHPNDDSYYLNHGADGFSSSHGCPYIENCDSQNFDEFNTVVYGHNMNDGSMFADLHKYENSDFLKSHNEIFIYTNEHVLSYKIFAAVMYSDDRIPYYYNDEIESDRIAFLDSLKTKIVKERSVILDEQINKDDKILTLSTCDRKLRENRFLVVAKLTKIDDQDVG